eukprot:6191782-Pleurochrysis_carterae.AAC.1
MQLVSFPSAYLMLSLLSFYTPVQTLWHVTYPRAVLLVLHPPTLLSFVHDMAAFGCVARWSRQFTRHAPEQQTRRRVRDIAAHLTEVIEGSLYFVATGADIVEGDLRVGLAQALDSVESTDGSTLVNTIFELARCLQLDGACAQECSADLKD